MKWCRSKHDFASCIPTNRTAFLKAFNEVSPLSSDTEDDVRSYNPCVYTIG